MNDDPMPVKGTCRANQFDHDLKPHEELVGVCFGWTPLTAAPTAPPVDMVNDPCPDCEHKLGLHRMAGCNFKIAGAVKCPCTRPRWKLAAPESPAAPTGSTEPQKCACKLTDRVCGAPICKDIQSYSGWSHVHKADWMHWASPTPYDHVGGDVAKIFVPCTVCDQFGPDNEEHTRIGGNRFVCTLGAPSEAPQKRELTLNLVGVGTELKELNLLCGLPDSNTELWPIGDVIRALKNAVNVFQTAQEKLGAPSEAPHCDPLPKVEVPDDRPPQPPDHQEWHSYFTNLAPYYIAEQIFYHVFRHGGAGNPLRSMNSKWFCELAAPKIRELLTAGSPSEAKPSVTEAAENLLHAMDTCHVCGTLLEVEGGPVYCKDGCTRYCDAHEGEECESISALHQKLRDVIGSEAKPASEEK